MEKFLTLKSVDQILQLIQQFAPLDTEDISLEDSFGRILAEPFLAPQDLPGFTRSSMDGYAVRAKDMFGASENMPALFDCIGECHMGETPALVIGPGQTARIWTGGMLPPGADAVVMLEYARAAGKNQIELTRPVAPLDHVITADEDAAKGATLLTAGSRLRPQELGLLAAFGVHSISVYKKPRVAIISSGDEVVAISATPEPGQVRDINSYTLDALVRACGAESRRLGISGDKPTELLALVNTTIDWADVVLVSGGSSAGQRDCTAQVFEALGAKILAHGVAISPGKPLILARKNQKSFWGLPGHVASALVCAEVFIRPLLYQLSGRQVEAAWQSGHKAVLTRSVASAQGRRDYIRVRVRDNAQSGALPLATPLMGKAGLITTLVEADALIICPEDNEGLSAGQIVELHELL
ncbi:MAG: molybdopterin molybdotransferase MoeA [Deltaproteobacteria bacterium]|jgi:molybdopterin molybdotransferase|nr:molybdopterin molybdotransferase MoeA [Deltaproteobacteria bacterium]